MTTNKGHPQLPDHYQITPYRSKKEEVAELLKKGGFGDKFYGDSTWYEIKYNLAEAHLSKREGVPVIEYSVWKNAILGITEYKVGDWITFINGDCRCGVGTKGDSLIGNTYQISKVMEDNSTNWQYQLVGNPFETTSIKGNNISIYNKEMYFRPATTAEIAKAQPVQEDYSISAIKNKKIAIHCSTAEEYAQVVTLCDNGLGKGNMSNKTNGFIAYGNRTHVMIYNYPGYGTNTDTTCPVIEASQFLAANSLPTMKEATPEEISRAQYPVQEEGWKVGDQFQYGGKGTVYTISRSSEGIHKCYYIKWMNDTVVKETSYTKEQIDGFWDKLWIPCKSQPVEANIPVTVDNVYIGMKVVATKAFLQQYTSLNNDANGIIISLAISGIPKMRVRFKHNTLYVAYSELTVAPQDTKEVNSSTINQSISSQIKTKTNVNNNQVKSTESILCSIISQTRCSEGRRQDSISCGNSRSLIGTGNL